MWPPKNGQLSCSATEPPVPKTNRYHVPTSLELRSGTSSSVCAVFPPYPLWEPGTAPGSPGPDSQRVTVLPEPREPVGTMGTAVTLSSPLTFRTPVAAQAVVARSQLLRQRVAVDAQDPRRSRSVASNLCEHSHNVTTHDFA
jgi:hypothetical protein